jgi:hypothetical protein
MKKTKTKNISDKHFADIIREIKYLREFSASEALIAFLSELTQYKGTIKIGHKHSVDEILHHFEEFRKKYKLVDVRPGWENKIITKDIGVINYTKRV